MSNSVLHAVRRLKAAGGSRKTVRLFLATLYFVIGTLAYKYFEGWDYLDSVYFMVVTTTTVGYGDFCPETPGGRLFTCVWGVLGITIVFSALSPLADAALKARENIERKVMNVFPWLREAEIPEDLDIPIEEVNAMINYKRRYFLAITGPLTMLLIVVFSSPWLLNLGKIDSIYFAMITMTTIGYGDISATTAPEANQTFAKVAACIFLPLAVTALAQSIVRRRPWREESVRRALVVLRMRQHHRARRTASAIASSATQRLPICPQRSSYNHHEPKPAR